MAIVFIFDFVSEEKWIVEKHQHLLKQCCEVFLYCAFFSCKIPVLDLSLKMFPVAFIVFAAVTSCSSYFSIIFRGGVGKNGSTIAVSL